MRIALLNLTGGGMSGGYRKYLLNMIPRLAAHPAVEFILCASPHGLNVKDWFGNLSNVDFIGCRPFRFMYHRPDSVLYDNLKKYRPDIIFIPLERYLKFENIPVVTMVRNMEPLLSPERPTQISERLRRWAQTFEAGIAVKRSMRVIAVSEFVKDFIIKKWGVPPDKMEVVYFGADSSVNGSCCRPELLPEDWDGNFLFTAGTIEIYRGLEDLIIAMEYVTAKNPALKLVIAGEPRKIMEDYRNKLKEIIKTKKLSKNILWTGNLNDAEMRWCFRHCAAFVMTTRVEACPNTALEALSNGCISIAADNPPLPEVFHNSASYYPSGDGRGLATVIEQVLGYDNTIRDKISGYAKSRASYFSWDITVRKTVEELSKAIGAPCF